MMKRYVYQPSHFSIQMTAPGIFTAAIGVFCLYQFLAAGHHLLYLLVFGLCLYNVFNVFVSLSNPSEVCIDSEKTIEFCAYGRSHTYEISQISRYSMRPLAGGTKMYMTFEGGGIMRGRYWVRISEFSDEKELEEFFYDLDAQINPDSLVSKARTQGRERLKKTGGCKC